MTGVHTCALPISKHTDSCGRNQNKTRHERTPCSSEFDSRDSESVVWGERVEISGGGVSLKKKKTQTKVDAEQKKIEDKKRMIETQIKEKQAKSANNKKKQSNANR